MSADEISAALEGLRAMTDRYAAERGMLARVTAEAAFRKAVLREEARLLRARGFDVTVPDDD